MVKNAPSVHTTSAPSSLTLRRPKFKGKLEVKLPEAIFRDKVDDLTKHLQKVTATDAS